jgi:hypothetical protein
VNFWKKLLAYWRPAKKYELRIEDLDDAWAERFCEMWKDRPCDLGYLESKGRMSVKDLEPYEAQAKAALNAANRDLVRLAQEHIKKGNWILKSAEGCPVVTHTQYKEETK